MNGWEVAGIFAVSAAVGFSALGFFLLRVRGEGGPSTEHSYVYPHDIHEEPSVEYGPPRPTAEQLEDADISLRDQRFAETATIWGGEFRWRYDRILESSLAEGMPSLQGEDPETHRQRLHGFHREVRTRIDKRAPPSSPARSEGLVPSVEAPPPAPSFPTYPVLEVTDAVPESTSVTASPKTRVMESERLIGAQLVGSAILVGRPKKAEPPEVVVEDPGPGEGPDDDEEEKDERIRRGIREGKKDWKVAREVGCGVERVHRIQREMAEAAE